VLTTLIESHHIWRLLSLLSAPTPPTDLARTGTRSAGACQNLIMTRLLLALLACAFLLACQGDDADGTPASAGAGASPATGSATAAASPPAPAAGTASATVSPATSTPAPDRTPQRPQIELYPEIAPAAFEHRSYGPTESVDLAHGIFSMDVATGVVVAWSLTGGDIRLVHYQSTERGRFISVTASRGDGTFAHLLDRDSGIAFHWTRDRRLQSQPVDGATLDLVAGPDEDTGFAIFTVLSGTFSDRPVASYLAQFLTSGFNLQQPLPVAIEGGAAYLLSEGGPRVLYWIDRGGTLRRLDLDGGTPETIAESVSRDVLRLEFNPDDNTVELAASNSTRDGSSLDLIRYHLDAKQVERTSIDFGDDVTWWNTAIAPDGRTAAWADWLDYGVPDGAGGTVHWGTVVFTDLQSGEPLFRVRQVSNCSASQPLQWLPDGSAYIVSTGAGFALVSPAEPSIELLPFPRGTPPVPAPGESAFFLYDGDVVDRSGALIRAAPRDLDWYRYVWGPDDSEVRYTIPVLDGFDSAACAATDLGLPPRIELPPFDDRIFLQVAAISTCLNLRETPRLDGASLACLPAGTVLQLTDGLDAAEYCNGTPVCSIAAHYVDPDQRWIHVRTLEGLEGWTAVAHLEHADPPLP
jgi:hypothetical protein